MMDFCKYRKATWSMCKKVKIKTNLDKTHELKYKIEGVDPKFN
jgi:hypothetical protein